MKTIISILALFFLVGIANAQIVNIPDVNFKSKLIQLGVDTNSDGDIQLAEALVPTSLNLNNSNISTLTGIEAFVNLQFLFCSDNQLTSLNVSNLTNLQDLFCPSNQLTSLNVNGLVNLQSLNCFNNQLTSLNTSTLTSLQSLSCSRNLLVSLNLSTSINLIDVACNENLLTSLNVSGLTNLEQLGCANNQLTNLDVSSLTNLQYLACHYNQLATLNPSASINLQTLICQNNQLTSLTVNNLANLQSLDCYSNLLTSLDLSTLTNLQLLDCSDNQLTNLIVTPLTSLQSLFCGANQLTSLDVSTLTNLQQLNCYDNQLSNLDVSALTNLQGLFCSLNQLTNLTIANLSNLQTVDCIGNVLTNLSLSNLPSLEILLCNDNQLTSLDVSGLTSLQTLNCQSNQLTTLDVSELRDLLVLLCHNNQLTTLFIKNGIVESVNFALNPALTFICGDEDEISATQAQVTSYGYTNCLVNSYCSFTPGGDFNTITGTIIFDQNNNGCDVSDSTFQFLNVGMDGTSSVEAMFTDSDGVYNFYTEVGTFDITPSLEISNYFTISPTNPNISFVDDNNNTITQDFCITANGIVSDLEAVLAPIIPAVPGDDAEYKLVYKNKGNQTLSGNVTLSYNDAVLDLVSVSTPSDAQGTGSLTWNFSNLLPLETRTILITMNVNSQTETPAVNVDDVLVFTTSINPVSADALPSDNVFPLEQIVVASFESNQTECLQGEEVTPSYIGEFLHYAIRFENTGNYPAEFVVVTMEIDPAEFDIESLQLLSASHEVYARVKGNKAEFIFENIDLAPLIGSDGGHGHIILKLSSITDLEINDTVTNMANIYYNYELPVITNDAKTVFISLNGGISESELDNTIEIYPNPSKGNVTITAGSLLKSVEIYDAQGRIIQTRILQSTYTAIDLSDQPAGIYFLKVNSESGSKVEQFVKE